MDNTTPHQNPSPDELRELLKSIRTIAVVGLSPKVYRPSHGVAESLQGFGYRIIPVRPAQAELLGEKCYATLDDIPDALAVSIDLVDVFRAPEHVGEIVDACIRRGFKRLWLQDGVVNEAAAARARAAGIAVIMDRCIYGDYKNLVAR